MDIPVFVRKNIHQKYSNVNYFLKVAHQYLAVIVYVVDLSFQLKEYSKPLKGEISMLVGSKVQLIATLDQEIIADKHVSVMLYTGTLSCGPTFVSLISNFSQGAM